MCRDRCMRTVPFFSFFFVPVCLKRYKEIDVFHGCKGLLSGATPAAVVGLPVPCVTPFPAPCVPPFPAPCVLPLPALGLSDDGIQLATSLSRGSRRLSVTADVSTAASTARLKLAFQVSVDHPGDCSCTST